MLASPDPNAGQNWDTKIADKSCENVSQFKYLLAAIRSRTFVFSSTVLKRKN
jgi:hypothetical protein